LIVGALLVTAVFLGWRSIEVPPFLHYSAVAGLAAAAVLGLHDPARPLLQALPTPPIVRLAHRAVLLVGATTASVAILLAAERLLALSPTSEPELAAALVALTVSGAAIHAAADPIIDRASEAAAMAILLWVAAAAAPTALPVSMSTAWLNHPWPVVAIAGAVMLIATTHRSA